ncbi:hypothetical protein [Shinella sp.]|uniref:hypothetical protein n=1 Tax=Shinella sp. TaxID=1870904 RepID=UPI0029ACC178|nr:hypothetical protein [Shinella sp.]MDX3977024.1 hypothetical protein [Shinella sp.]
MHFLNDGRRCPSSPGPVKLEEIVALGLYHPDLIDKDTGKITKEALKTDVLGEHTVIDNCGESSGLSVARLATQPDLNELKAVISQIASRPKKDGTERVVVGHSTVAVKWLIDNGTSVLDDGKIGFASHAVVRSTMKRSAVKKLREDMIGELNKTLVRW